MRLRRDVPELRGVGVPIRARFGAALAQAGGLSKPAVTWLLMLAAAQGADVLTTVVGQARGTFELSPFSQHLLEQGGIGLFLAFKLTLVLVLAATLVRALMWSRTSPRRAMGVVRAVVLTAQVGSVVVVATAFANVLVISST